LGSSHDDVNKLMDLPAHILGKKHRVLLHDPISAFIMFGRKPEKFEAAILHILVDKLAENPELRKLLESLV